VSHYIPKDFLRKRAVIGVPVARIQVRNQTP